MSNLYEHLNYLLERKGQKTEHHIYFASCFAKEGKGAQLEAKRIDGNKQRIVPLFTFFR
jgi:hypothetical protein